MVAPQPTEYIPNRNCSEQQDACEQPHRQIGKNLEVAEDFADAVGSCGGCVS